MGNCCGTPNGAADAGGGKKPKEPKQKKGKKPNPFSNEYNGSTLASASRLVVLREPMKRNIAERYELGAELGRGEFRITYLCTDRASGEALACKSISKKKLCTPSTSRTCVGRSIPSPARKTHG
jgi:calcium-dependent protein kinase